MALQIDQFMCRSDNFGVLIHDPESGETALIDAPEERAILAAVERTGWTPTMILTTHHHQRPCRGQSGAEEAVRPEDRRSEGGGCENPRHRRSSFRKDRQFEFAGQPVQVIETPGHTAGHVSYYLPRSHVAFAADTLFAMGCGRLLERPAPVMFHSLTKLVALPAATDALLRPRIHAGQCALRAYRRPDQFGAEGARGEGREAARRRTSRRCRRRSAEELATNPFLRWHDPAIRRNLGMEEATDAEVFAEIRKRKDNF